ncbi:anti-sigma factor [Cryobacterium sp. 1639]|uniref:anti-sigma factor domain-containing protein n=1 Tax=Cryobacterium inferilacus TaxID=2866629 RepID=UPI001C731993|nr:anti-sigma factor [Cryobacterium sp. 1639]MBX0299851.1 anti-sigma factor [Cryobacterium sp. 1639]
MTHLDRDALALVALAELDLSPAESEHLAACPACTGELDALRRTVLIGRSAGSVTLIEPADAVWGRIHSALGLTDAVATPPRLTDLAGASDAAALAAAAAAGAPTHAQPSAVEPAPAEAQPQSATPAPADAPAESADSVPGSPPTEVPPHPVDTAPGSEESGPTASVVDLAGRRRAWLPVAAAACAVGLVGGIAGGVWWQSTRTPAAAPVIAEAQLDALPGWTASGSASVEESADGRRDVVVDVSGGAEADGLREVWLLTADATGLVSVGLLDGSTGRFSIPAGIDLAEYPVVDVSAEPADGNPAHSGDSIVRGTLSGI